MPTLETTPIPVTTTRSPPTRRFADLGAHCTAPSALTGDRLSLLGPGLFDDHVHVLQVDHPVQLGLVDQDAERALKAGQDLAGPQRNRVLLLLEEARLGDLVGLQFENL